MKRLILLCIILGSLSACGNVQPAKSSCFQNGAAICKFTPLTELWAKEPNADAVQAPTL